MLHGLQESPDLTLAAFLQYQGQESTILNLANNLGFCSPGRTILQLNAPLKSL
jgi:hypothetical protein